MVTPSPFSAILQIHSKRSLAWLKCWCTSPYYATTFCGEFFYSLFGKKHQKYTVTVTSVNITWGSCVYCTRPFHQLLLILKTVSPCYDLSSATFTKLVVAGFFSLTQFSILLPFTYHSLWGVALHTRVHHCQRNIFPNVTPLVGSLTHSCLLFVYSSREARHVYRFYSCSRSTRSMFEYAHVWLHKWNV